LVLHPLIVYGLCALGAVGVLLALPRRGNLPQIFGALIASLAGGAALIVMGLKAKEHLPNLHFYIFAFIALAAALRVITHPKPVYAALYFVLTVIASAGLFVLLSAEFMAFALIIVYAGAILITYLFVIMLATQSPDEDEVEVLASYDTEAREPAVAVVIGFLMLAVLTTTMFSGLSQLGWPKPRNPDALLAEMPRKIENVFREHRLIAKGESVIVDEKTHQAQVILDGQTGGTIAIRATDGTIRQVERKDWPAELKVRNIEELGFNLLRDHPGTIEIAGVILLMAMLGAVVLSRKQVQIDDDAKMRQSRRLAETGEPPTPGLNERSPLVTNQQGGTA
jgi:NADH-quinone oxidoreductase subunit J